MFSLGGRELLIPADLLFIPTSSCVRGYQSYVAAVSGSQAHAERSRAGAHRATPSPHQTLHRSWSCSAGMTGSLVVKGVKSHQYKSFKVDGSDWPPKYWKLLLDLEEHVSIAFSDSRRFARVRLQVCAVGRRTCQ